jgi:hypothetical protein
MYKHNLVSPIMSLSLKCTLQLKNALDECTKFLVSEVMLMGVVHSGLINNLLKVD